MRRVGLAVSVVGPGLLLTAASPWLALTVAIGLVTNYLLGFLFAPLAAVQALVSPARERSLSFSLGAIFLVLGVIVFFVCPGRTWAPTGHGRIIGASAVCRTRSASSHSPLQ